MRQRFLSFTAGARQLVPLRVFAPHRGLINIGAVLRLWASTRKLFFAGSLGLAGARLSLGFFLARWVRLNRTYDRLPARFDVDIPDVHTAGTISPNTLERIDELRNHRRTLEGVPEVKVPML
jgi:hypothetical protein